MDLPKIYDFGSGELVELKHLEKTFNISRRIALKYLKVLRIQPLYIGDEIFFSLPTFNRIMFVLSRPGSPGFIFPGSKAKQNQKLREKGFLIRVTDEILREAQSPRILAEMAAASGRNDAMVKKLLAHPTSAEAKK
uniref:Uncharacterized protein n=1 Tax=viral metagenome TaxID=1070528 RepID=A0A6M3KD60_9ZZZZ